MVFIGGPRQVGKTIFALTFLSEVTEKHPAYLNWDNVTTRSSLFRGELPSKEKCIVFDEIHKFGKWRNLVKGFYDTNKSERSFIITGSARLDYYSRGGDSLQGRYHYYRLHPFSLIELNKEPSKEDFRRLLKFGGFPEPFLKGEEKFWRRWQNERTRRVVSEDIRDLENVKDISLLELLALELPNRVGAVLSVKNLKELFQVSHETVERWLKIFERMYYCFRIPPYGSPKVRAVKKEQKLYLWDWSLVPESGPRFENFIASQLLKYCHFIEDTEGYRMDLRFLRDIEKREVDFVVLEDGKPLFAVECKTGEKAINPSLFYFMDRTKIPKFYQVHEGNRDFEKNGVRVLPVRTFCKELQLP
ncbi:MAG: ATP-binding protein [Deltaproteobacteria bacterium]|nr:ATP-binding protein [Deltaproteobacteria bacterium]